MSEPLSRWSTVETIGRGVREAPALTSGFAVTAVLAAVDCSTASWVAATAVACVGARGVAATGTAGITVAGVVGSAGLVFSFDGVCFVL